MRLDTLVIGLDFGEASLMAAQWAALHFAPGAQLVLVHAIEVPPPPGFLREVLPPYEKMLELAHKDAVRPMQELTRTFGASPVRTVIREGRPATEIAAVAREVGADLIVVAERGRDPRSRMLLGSTAEQLAQCAPVAVLLARGLPDAPPTSLLTPMDEGDVSLEVLRWANFLRHRFTAGTTVVHALNTGLYGLYRLVRSEAELRAIERRSREAASEWAEERLQDAGFEPGSAAIEVEFGDPGFEVVAAAERKDADLVLIGHGNAGAAEPPELGRVARAVLRGSSLPTLIVADPACD